MTCPAPRRLGLVSDTHGLLRAEATAFLQGCERIVHAGDIGDAAVLAALAAIAPLTAVRGNNDRGPWAEDLPASATLQIDAVRILVLHDIADLACDPGDAGYRVVVSGHSHRPALHERDGVLYVNPGSAGRRRFRLPVAVGELFVHGDTATARLVELSA